ncbi:MAG: trimethylamine methyltransferase family protein [Deltaproteobacteria bacterium]|nr:trimethylamine methyltransferase family protein [Deltaproteobacteria bacterium]
MSDAQAGHEKTISALLSALAGANLIYGAGMLEAGMTFSFGQLVIDDEIAAMVKRIVNGISLDDELMGVDLIKKVGIGNNFLTQRHTLNHLESEQVQATIIDRRMRGAWEKRGSKSLIQSANQKAAELLKTHEPQPLPQELIKELKRIVKSAE